MKNFFVFFISFVLSLFVVKHIYSLNIEKTEYKKIIECKECTQYTSEISELRKDGVIAQIERWFIDSGEDLNYNFVFDDVVFVYMRAEILYKNFKFGFDLFGSAGTPRAFVIHSLKDSISMNIINESGGLWGCYGNILQCWKGNGPFCSNLIPFQQLLKCEAK